MRTTIEIDDELLAKAMKKLAQIPSGKRHASRCAILSNRRLITQEFSCCMVLA